MDERVIDIRRYRDAEPEGDEGRAFAVWGGEGDRTRLALPVWRAIHVLDGERGGIAFLPKDETGGGPHPFFLLDLRQDPVAQVFPTRLFHSLRDGDLPSLEFTPDGDLAVLLGEDEKRWWFLQVLGGNRDGPPDAKARETLLFLAGECAGLLFFRKLGI